MERQQRPQRPQAPQRPMQNQQMQGQQMQQQMYNQQMYNQQMQNMQGQQMQGQQDINLQKGGKPKKKNKLKIVLIVIGVIILLVGIGILLSKIATGRVSTRVVELEAEVARLEQTIDDNNAAHREEVEKLNQAIADTTVKEVVPTTSLQRVEATQVPEFWLIEGDFIAPNPLKIPDAVDSINDSHIQIGQRFIFRPSDRWVLVSQGSTYEFNHPNKIWGKIRALTLEEPIPEANMKTMIQEFFIGYPATEISYRKVYIEDRVSGMIGRANITVNYTDSGEISEEGKQSKEMCVNVGFIQRGEYVLSLIFLYDLENGSSSQELVDLLLRSGSVGAGGSTIKLE